MTTFRKSFIVIVTSLLLILSIRVLANSHDEICRWNISATADDSVFAALYEISDGEYGIEISGTGKMKDFSDLDLPPWFEYSDNITFVEVGIGVESIGYFSFNFCFSLEKIVIKEPNAIFSILLFPIPGETQIYAHENSSLKEYCSVFLPERFSSICEYEDSVCTVCNHECTEHIGGEANCESGARCDICKTEYTERAAHDFGDLLPEIPATCTKTGVIAHYECSLCDEIQDSDGNTVSESELVIPIKHTLGDLIPYSPPECEKSGVKEHYHCDACGENFDKNGQPIADIYIPENNHSGGIATCTSLAICKVCESPYGATNPENHSFSKELSYDGDEHWYECACGEVKSRAEHTYSSRVILPPTETEEGIEELYCSCGYKYEQEIPKTSATEPNSPDSQNPQDTQNTTKTDGDGGSIILPVVIITVSVVSVAAVAFVLVRKFKK